MKRLIVALLLAVLCLTAQVPTVPNTDHATFRTNLNSSLQDAASISGGYSNPSWITSMAFAKLSGVPAFARTDQGNTWTTGAQDFSAATHLRVPNAAGYTPTLNGHFGYDSTANAFKGYVGASIKTFAFLDSNITGTAVNLSGTPALPNGTTATTQTVGDNTTKVATTAFVLANAGSGGSFTGLVPAKVSGATVTVAAGNFGYGTNVAVIPGTVTFTLQTVSIASITTGTATLINTSTPMTNLVNGQSVSVSLSGTGSGCAAGNGVFVATAVTTTQFQIPANTSGGCTGPSGTVGSQSGGTIIVYGNSAGQVELNHSAAMGALVSVTGTSGVVNQSSTVTFPNGSIPIAYITVAAGAFDTLADYRTPLSSVKVQAGQGIDVTASGGQPQISVASNVAMVDQVTNWVNAVNMTNATRTAPNRVTTGNPNGRDNCVYPGETAFASDTGITHDCITPGTPGVWIAVSGPGFAPYVCAVAGVSSISCTHNLNTIYPHVACFDTATGDQLGSTGLPYITRVHATSANVALITFSVAQTGPCLISTGNMGPTGAAGAPGANGTNGTNGAGFASTSTTSLATNLTAKTLTTQTGLAWAIGGCLRLASRTAPSDSMIGPITAYDSSTGVLQFTPVARAAGQCSGSSTSGTSHTDWDLQPSGVAGADGSNGTGAGLSWNGTIVTWN